MLKSQCPPFSLRRPNARAMFGVSNDCAQEMFVLTSTSAVTGKPSVHHTKTVFHALLTHFSDKNRRIVSSRHVFFVC